MHWLELYNETEYDIPSKELFDLWIAATLGGQDGELSIKVVSKEKMMQLNSQYRNKNQATDVLSFAYTEDYQTEETPHLPYLGDVAICAEILQKDAKKQNKTIEEHWAHITIHSVLHLLGYDHQSTEDQQEMEQLESKIMLDLKLNNPWNVDDVISEDVQIN